MPRPGPPRPDGQGPARSGPPRPDGSAPARPARPGPPRADRPGPAQPPRSGPPRADRPRPGQPRPGRPRPAAARPPRRTKTMITVLAAVTGASLAIGTGFALDRVVLPELRSEPASAHGAAPRPDSASSSPLPEDKAQPEAAPSARPSNVPAPGGGGLGSAPLPLKPLRGALPTASASPKPTTSTTPRPGGGNGGDNDTDGGGNGGGAPAPGASGPEGAVVTLTNKERAKAGCGALRTDSRLTTAARRHSADMAKHNYLDHTSRNGDSPWKRMEDAGYTGGGAENIARGYPTAEAVVAGWMKSPGHRANILNCKLRAIGVGMAAGSGGPWWTQNFGWK
ncbi:CAP domain-containing protein [Spirillospora sp. NPDC127200]